MISPIRCSRRGFTLIELLVVIAILGILMTLLFPAVQGAMEAAKKTQAKNDVTQIVTAINAYVTEYGRMPVGSGSDVTDANSDGQLWDILTGKNTDANPRGIVFMEVPNAKSGKNGRVGSGSTASGPFYDSWGKAYVIAIDGSYDNEVDGGPNGKVAKTVIAWSYGTPAKGKANTDPKKFVKSWE